MNMQESGFYSVLPWITMAITANVGGWLADKLIESGVPTIKVRTRSRFKMRTPPGPKHADASSISFYFQVAGVLRTPVHHPGAHVFRPTGSSIWGWVFYTPPSQGFPPPDSCVREIVVRLAAAETLTLSGRTQSNGREWVGYHYCRAITPNHPW
jgi:hypothetical protein